MTDLPDKLAQEEKAALVEIFAVSSGGRGRPEGASPKARTPLA